MDPMSSTHQAVERLPTDCECYRLHTHKAKCLIDSASVMQIPTSFRSPLCTDFLDLHVLSLCRPQHTAQQPPAHWPAFPATFPALPQWPAKTAQQPPATVLLLAVTLAWQS